MKQKVDDVDYLRTLVIEVSNGEFGHDLPTSLLIEYLRNPWDISGSVWKCDKPIKSVGYNNFASRTSILKLYADKTYFAIYIDGEVCSDPLD